MGGVAEQGLEEPHDETTLQTKLPRKLVFGTSPLEIPRCLALSGTLAILKVFLVLKPDVGLMIEY